MIERTPEEKNAYREDLILVNELNLRRLLKRHMANGKQAQDLYGLVVMVDDPPWSGLASALMPGFDWQPYREIGAEPMAVGLIGKDANTKTLFKEVLPSLSHQIDQDPEPGTFHVWALADGGALLYALAIEEQPEAAKAPLL